MKLARLGPPGAKCPVVVTDDAVLDLSGVMPDIDPESLSRRGIAAAERAPLAARRRHGRPVSAVAGAAAYWPAPGPARRPGSRRPSTAVCRTLAPAPVAPIPGGTIMSTVLRKG